MQTILAMLIVLAATGYSVWKLAPASLRRRFAARGLAGLGDQAADRTRRLK